MARATFGATAADYVISVGPGGLLRVAPATMTFWTAAAGGSQHTDLLLDGAPTSTITVGADGIVPSFQGPDGVIQMWADAGGGDRIRIVAGGDPGPPGPPGVADDPSVAALLVDDGSDTYAAAADLATAAVPTFNPRVYGASANPLVDSRAGLTSAFAAAVAAGGGTIVLDRVYGWKGVLTVPNGVMLAGVTTRQNPTPDEAPTIGGLVALDSAAQLQIGSWSAGGAAKPAGVTNLHVDGNYLGGDDAVVAKSGLARIAGVNAKIDNLFAVRSAGDGIVYDGLQNSTVIGGGSTLHAGCALVLDNGAGAIAFLGGYYGTSGGGVLDMRDTPGESNLYPFGPTQNTFTGTIFEAYGTLDAAYPSAPLDLPYPFHVRVSGRANKFTGCNFTAGAPTTANCAVLVDASASIIAPSATFDSCLYWLLEDADAVRVTSAAQLAFIGQQEISDNGTDHGASFLCIDTATPQVALAGPIIFNGDTNGDKIIRTIGGGSSVGVFTMKDGGDTYRLRSTQVVGIRPQGQPNNSLQFEQGGIVRWLDPATGGTHASLQRATEGGAGLVATGRLTLADSLVLYPEQQSVPGVGSTITINALTSTEHRLAFTNDATITTLAITNPYEGAQLRIGLFGVGTNTITWPSSIQFNGGTGPQPSNGTAVYVDLTYHHALSKWVEVSRSTGGSGPAGADGASAYQVAVDEGFVGDEAAWLASLVGDDGDPGSAGADGAAGPAGPPGPIGTTINTTVSAGTYTLNPAYGTDYTMTLTGNITLAATGLNNGAGMTVDLVQDGVGGRTVTLPTSWIGHDTVVIDTTPNIVTSLVIRRSPLGYLVTRVGTAALPSSFWSPNSLSSRIAWFDANAIQGEDGDTVTAWDNPWGVDGTIAGGPVLKVLNGEKYVQFDGVDDHVDSDNGSAVNQPFVYAFLAKVAGNGPVISGTAGQTTALDIETVGGNWQLDPGTSGPTRPNNATWQTVIIQIISGGDDTIRVDGTGATGPAGTLKVGRWLRFGASDAGTHHAMNLAEFIEVSGTIDAPTLANIEAYLNTKRDHLNGV